jgi:hypothetical protein
MPANPSARETTVRTSPDASINFDIDSVRLGLGNIWGIQRLENRRWTIRENICFPECLRHEFGCDQQRQNCGRAELGQHGRMLSGHRRCTCRTSGSCRQKDVHPIQLHEQRVRSHGHQSRCLSCSGLETALYLDN